MRLEGRAFGDVPLNLEYKLEVWDSPNSAGIIIDAVRAAKIAKDRGIGGPILSASSYFMKSPPEQYRDDEARRAVEAFIRGERQLIAVAPGVSRRSGTFSPDRAAETCALRCFVVRSLAGGFTPTRANRGPG